MNETLRGKLDRFQMAGLVIGLIGVALCVLGAFVSTDQFFISYLFAYVFWLGLALGCLAVAMIHYLTGGRWGDETRRVFEAGYMTLPLMALLFLPILFGVNHLYPWAKPAEVAVNKVLQGKSHYLNFSMFIARYIFVFAVWTIMAWLLRQWSVAQDQTADLAPLRRMRTLSGPGLVIYVLTATVAFVDWVMSLEPDWYSTMFPVIVCISQILTAFAFSTMMLAWFRHYEPLSEFRLTAQFHQLGNLLLAFVIFWTYVSFGQFLIIWAGNLPHEIVWYLHRIAGHWKWVAGFLAMFHFFLPFFLLLFRATKRRAQTLASLAAMIFAAHIVAVYWVITPSFHPQGVQISWIDFAAWLGVGGVWVAMFAAMLKRAPLLPQNDPRIHYPVANAQAHAS
ncbi:MAG: hypothetical protein JWQ04_1266 [Pedosphaera sp.]|nr:hypothetical protein [Pedosphaera sp.]